MEELLRILRQRFLNPPKKKCKVDQAIANGTYIANIIIGNTFSEIHLAQFIELWLLVNDVQLHTGVEDSIVWKLTANGQYSAALQATISWACAIRHEHNRVEGLGHSQGQAPCVACLSK
jgi:hypothetical protein